MLQGEGGGTREDGLGMRGAAPGLTYGRFDDPALDRGLAPPGPFHRLPPPRPGAAAPRLGAGRGLPAACRGRGARLVRPHEVTTPLIPTITPNITIKLN